MSLSNWMHLLISLSISFVPLSNIPHRCGKNFSAYKSSKEMEPHCIVEMIKYLASVYGVYVQHLVADDDATIRARLQHPGENEEAELPNWCITPLKWADPNHRGKCAGDQAFKKANEKGCRIDNHIAATYKKNFKGVIHMVKKLPMAEKLKHKDAPVLHMFGDHSCCTDTCPGKNNPTYKSRATPYCFSRATS